MSDGDRELRAALEAAQGRLKSAHGELERQRERVHDLEVQARKLEERSHELEGKTRELESLRRAAVEREKRLEHAERRLEALTKPGQLSPNLPSGGMSPWVFRIIAGTLGPIWLVAVFIVGRESRGWATALAFFFAAALSTTYWALRHQRKPPPARTPEVSAPPTLQGVSAPAEEPGARDGSQSQSDRRSARSREGVPTRQ